MKTIFIILFILSLSVCRSQATIVGHISAEVVESVEIDSIFIYRMNTYQFGCDMDNNVSSSEMDNYFIMKKIDNGKMNVDLIMN